MSYIKYFTRKISQPSVSQAYKGMKKIWKPEKSDKVWQPFVHHYIDISEMIYAGDSFEALVTDLR